MVLITVVTVAARYPRLFFASASSSAPVQARALHEPDYTAEQQQEKEEPVHKTQGPYILLQAKLDMTEYNALVADAYALPSVGGLPPRPVTQWNTT